MLVCNVSLRPARAAIAVAIVESATAVASTATGNVVFAALVDDPANVRDTIDAYLGEIMLEAASADAAVDAGLEYIGAVAEEATATDTQDGTVGIPLVPRDAMVEGVFINSDGTSRDANAGGVMINL